VNEIKNKREVTIPDVKINQSLFENLEKYFSSVVLDELSSGMYRNIGNIMAVQRIFHL